MKRDLKDLEPKKTVLGQAVKEIAEDVKSIKEKAEPGKVNL